MPDDAATIAGALTIVHAGGTVHVRTGTHAGGFVIDKPVTVEGEGWDNTVIDGGSNPVAITVQTSGATLTAFKVATTAPNDGIRLISASNNTMDRVWTDGGEFGVRFQYGSNVNQVVGSRATNAVEWGYDGGDTSSSGNTYRGVEAYGNAGGIVAYAGSNGTTVLDSNLHDNGVGFQIGWSSGWSITRTHLTHNQRGLIIDTASSGTASDNDISGNTGLGVGFWGLGQFNNTISGNRIHGNGDAGLRFGSDSSSNLVTGNDIAGNGIGIHVYRNDGHPNYGNTVYHNTLWNNTVNAQADGVLTIARAQQTIDFAAIFDQTVGSPPLALHATASSGLRVLFTTTTPSVCTVGGKNLDKLTLVGPGTCNVTADQGGNGNYLAAPPVPQTFTVKLGVATITVTSDRATAVFGQAVKVTATVAGAPGQPTGTVTFMDGPDVLATQPLAVGKATLTIRTLGVGLHDISAVYGGDATHSGATSVLAGGVTVAQGTTKVTITNARDLQKKSTRVGEAYVVNALVAAAAPSAGVPTGSVTISDGIADCTAALASDGTAFCSLTGTEVGTRTITVTYAGDPNFTGAAASVIHKVVKP